tara:strand:- start:2065 stop:2241 length:177 start_codon:yes stop_codon:yes gene_type:complete
MPKITIDIDLPYDDMPYDDMPEGEALIFEDIIDEDAPEEIVITCPTCGAVMAEDFDED